MARRRKKQSRPPVTVTDKQPTPRIETALIVSIIAVMLLGGIPFGVGKYIELNSPGPFDSGAYVYSAQRLLDGAQYGTEERSSARPGTLIANLIGVKLFGFSDTGPKIVQMVLQVAALIFMFITIRKVFGSVAAILSTAIAAIYLSAPLIAKFGNVKEQFMIAWMVAAACALIWYEYTNKNIWLGLCGFFALQPYYFKPTGMSIVFAVVFYLLGSRVLARNFKHLWVELLYFLRGYAIGMIVPGALFIWLGVLPKLLRTFPPVAIAAAAVILFLTGLPIYIHTKKTNNTNESPQFPVWPWALGITAILLILIVLFRERILAAAGLKGGGYLADSLSAKGLSKVAPQIFRYYKALAVPMLAAMTSAVIALVIWIRARINRTPSKDIQSKLVWMLAIWWMLDVAFTWISPRSYEQYYLPLCASAAMLSGYAVWKWQKRLMLSTNKMPWLFGGLAAAITLGCLSIPIFIGQRYSPDTGNDYIKTYGHRRRGFGPALKELPTRKKSPWIDAGRYIRTHSTKEDTIYVWGWIPGIYVQAQRTAPVPKAFDGNMHVTPPKTLARQINSNIKKMQQNPPKFIVDTRKRHFPNDRPQLELWPIVMPGVLGNEKARPLSTNPQEIAAYDAKWKKALETQIEPEEAERYEAMKPFRDFVMNNYRIVRQFGNHIVFEKK
ncbi:MAG: glycosyltransferase family 39 protein [Planctomycetota bacterium]|jgi:hypothetical protein